MTNINQDIVNAMAGHTARIKRLEEIENLALSDELAHALGAGIPASAGVALDATSVMSK